MYPTTPDFVPNYSLPRIVNGQLHGSKPQNAFKAQKLNTTSDVSQTYIRHSRLPTNTFQRRRAQNREAQRNFRDRKEKRTKDLEVENKGLKEKIERLEAENAKLATQNFKNKKAIKVLSSRVEADGDRVTQQLLDILQSDCEVLQEDSVKSEDS